MSVNLGTSGTLTCDGVTLTLSPGAAIKASSHERAPAFTLTVGSVPKEWERHGRLAN